MHKLLSGTSLSLSKEEEMNIIIPIQRRRRIHFHISSCDFFQVDEDICQQRIICDIFSDAEKFKPVSDIFMKKLT